jgi:hypothetical protein
MISTKLKHKPAEAQLLIRYRSSRGRLNGTLDLLDRALDLIEQLQWGLDLDLMVGEVAAFARACRAFGRRVR